MAMIMKASWRHFVPLDAPTENNPVGCSQTDNWM
jgi:hypothetical protein